MRNIDSIEGYTLLLKLFYSYFGGIEDDIKNFDWSDELPDYPDRRKTDTLERDIHFLNGSLPKKAKYPAIPAIEDQIQAFGALYVIEGSTLGGQIISGMFTKKLNLSENGLSFFRGYGDSTRQFWGNFKAALDRHSDNANAVNKIIASANETFTKFKLILEKNEVCII